MEMRAHSLADSLMCWAAGPPGSWGITPPSRGLKSGNITGPAASGSAFSWKEFGCDWKVI